MNTQFVSKGLYRVLKVNRTRHYFIVMGNNNWVTLIGSSKATPRNLRIWEAFMSLGTATGDIVERVA